MALQNAELVWNEEKQKFEFALSDMTTSEIQEHERQQQARQAELDTEAQAAALKQVDFAELRGQKAQTAIDKLDDDLKKFDTATNTERLAMQKRMMTYLLAVMKIQKHQLDPAT